MRSRLPTCSATQQDGRQHHCCWCLALQGAKHGMQQESNTAAHTSAHVQAGMIGTLLLLHPQRCSQAMAKVQTHLFHTMLQPLLQHPRWVTATAKQPLHECIPPPGIPQGPPAWWHHTRHLGAVHQQPLW